MAMQNETYAYKSVYAKVWLATTQYLVRLAVMHDYYFC